jgi:hypothetical protein
MGCPESRSSTFRYPPLLPGGRPVPMLSKIFLMWRLRGYMLKANILGSVSPDLWPTDFNASPELSYYKGKLSYMLNLRISKFDFLVL